MALSRASTRARGLQSAHLGPISAQSSWKSREMGFPPIMDLKEARKNASFLLQEFPVVPHSHALHKVLSCANVTQDFGDVLCRATT